MATVARAELILPRYRNMRHFAALGRLGLGDPAGALELALSNQKRHEYHQGTIRLLVKLAARDRKLTLFLAQIERVFRAALVCGDLYKKAAARDIYFLMKDQATALTIVGSENHNGVTGGISRTFARKLLPSCRPQTAALPRDSLAAMCSRTHNPTR